MARNCVFALIVLIFMYAQVQLTEAVFKDRFQLSARVSGKHLQ